MKFYKGDIESLSCSKLPQQFKERAERYKKENRKKASLAGYALLREALLENGINTESVSFSSTGKPICDNIFISLSHSADLAVCCLSEKRVGVDAEKIRQIKKREKYKFFSLSECEFVNNSENSSLAFFKVWTMKEAYKKATDCLWKEIAEADFCEKGKIKTEYKGYKFQTKIYGEYIVSICEKTTET
ncbi:MAG: 4'-phosphopantetheinyl transferase superfamily protein [Clostridia bacterium]|nr:4'-phosphopantetheinyl transferase superfamily protein [Clostridia bacterium]